jgi:hypothetical protein
LSSEAARVLLLLPLPLPLPLLIMLVLLRVDLVVVRDQVREQLSTTMVVIFLPVVVDAAAAVGIVAVVSAEEVCFSALPPDLSEMSLGGPLADANEIFSGSNSTGPNNDNQNETLIKSLKTRMVGHMVAAKLFSIIFFS